MFTIFSYILIAFQFFSGVVPDTTSGEGCEGEEAATARLMELVRRYDSEHSSEEVRLHVPATTLMPGDTLFFSAYIIDKEYDAPTQRSLTLYTGLLDTKGHWHAQEAFYIEEGRTAGYIPLPEGMPSGGYSLVGYTARQQQYMPTEIAIQKIQLGATGQTVLKEPGFSFEPEGGHILAGLPVNISVFCENIDRLAHPARAVIIDGKGRKVTRVAFDEAGKGSFTLMPYLTDFTLVTTDKNGNEIKKALPTLKRSGAALSLVEMRGDSVARLAVRTTPGYTPEALYLAAVQDGELLLNRKVSLSRQAYYDIPVGDLPEGLLHVGLLDETLTPVSALDIVLAWTESHDIEVKLDSCRETGGYEIFLTAPDGEVLKGQFSLTAWSENMMESDEHSPLRTVSPVQYWLSLQDADQEETQNLKDYEVCRLMLLDRKGRPVPETLVKIEEEPKPSIIRTSKDGCMRLPNYRLNKTVTFLLPKSDYSLAILDSGNDAFREKLSATLSGVDHAGCPHPSHQQKQYGKVRIRQVEANRWEVSKYRMYSLVQGAMLGGSAATYWQDRTLTDEQGRLLLNLPEGWPAGDYQIRFSGFTEDGWYIDRRVQVN